MSSYTGGRFQLPGNPIGLPPGIERALSNRGQAFNERMPWYGVSGLADIVTGRYPLPWNPIQPHDQVGALPKAPDMTFDMIEPDRDFAFTDSCSGDGMGCACGGGCRGGMGALAVPTWAASLPAPLNSSAMGIPIVYLGLGAIALYFFSTRKGRR